MVPQRRVITYELHALEAHKTPQFGLHMRQMRGPPDRKEEDTKRMRRQIKQKEKWEKRARERNLKHIDVEHSQGWCLSQIETIFLKMSGKGQMAQIRWVLPLGNSREVG